MQKHVYMFTCINARMHIYEYGRCLNLTCVLSAAKTVLKYVSLPYLSRSKGLCFKAMLDRCCLPLANYMLVFGMPKPYAARMKMASCNPFSAAIWVGSGCVDSQTSASAGDLTAARQQLGDPYDI